MEPRPVASPLVPFTLLLASLPAVVGAQLGSHGTQFWSQDSPGLDLTRTTDAEMGTSLAAGDFDCDGFTDLAIGMPGDTVSGEADAGEVVVLYGSQAGPVTPNRDLLSQNTPGIQGGAENGDRFGSALAAGDFDGDGCDDLAIGAPGESIEAPELVVEAGSVHVLYGGGLGLGVDGDDLFTQDTEFMPGVAQTDDRFGSVLLGHDLDQDGVDELIIGVPDEDIEGDDPVPGAGSVHVLWGIQNGGLSAAAGILLFPGEGPINYGPNDFDRFGESLAAGELMLGGGHELAIGVPGRMINGDASAGMVAVLSDVEGGSLVVGVVTQLTDGVPGEPEPFDDFGAALAAGDFDGNGFDELAVGAPGEDLESIPAEAAGAVFILNLLNGIYSLWVQGDLTPETSEPFDFFGSSLAAGDWNGDGRDDLAIGVPGETLGGLSESGVVHAVLGSPWGLVYEGRQLWLQTIDPSEAGDRFGATIVAGRFSGHSGEDLAIGVPGENLSGTSDTGGVNLLFSVVLFHDDFESGNPCRWSASEGAPTC